MTSEIYNKTDKVVAKIILSGKLKNTSPLVIGNGRNEEADTEIIKLPGGQAYIPASSISGKLSGIFKKFQVENREIFLASDFYQFWGGSYNTGGKENSFQSHIAIDELISSENAHLIALKDGVKINYESGTAEEGSKYDYQVLEPGVLFPFKAEITVRERNRFDIFKKIAVTIASLLESGIYLGAFTNTGHGKVIGEDFTIHTFSFNDDFDSWIEYLKDDKLPSPIDRKSEEIFSISEVPPVTIQARFSLLSPLISATYGVEAHQADKVMAHRKNNRKEKILSGKSIKGVIRNRTSKILHTLIQDGKKAEEILTDMFGLVDTKNQSRAVPAKVRVEEAILNNVKTFTQNRIKVDRFTGGTIDTALMETNPVAPSLNEELRLEFSLNKYNPDKKYQVTLLLMVLKDLWTGDLPLGGEKGIGRGRLQGKYAKVTIQDKSIELEENDGFLSISDPSDLLKNFNMLELPTS